jgi:hypothetical protein
MEKKVKVTAPNKKVVLKIHKDWLDQLLQYDYNRKYNFS